MSTLNSFGASFGIPAAPIRAGKSDADRAAALLPEIGQLVTDGRITLPAAEVLQRVVQNWRAARQPTPADAVTPASAREQLQAAGCIEMRRNAIGAVSYQPAPFLQKAPAEVPSTKADAPLTARLKARIGSHPTRSAR